jgi:hypothetical protein
MCSSDPPTKHDPADKAESLVVAVGAFLRERHDLESVAGDVFLSFAGDGFDEVITILDDFPHERGVAEVAAIEFVVRIRKRISGNAFRWVESIANGQRHAIG